jgi:hypothetical protein
MSDTITEGVTAEAAAQAGMETILVNVEDLGRLEIPQAVKAGWVIANAPRPLIGDVTWQGPFMHGVFYAAAPELRTGSFGWKADDACLLQVTTNAELQAQLQAKLDDYGTTLEEVGMTWAEFAGSYSMPWHEPKA